MPSYVFTCFYIFIFCVTVVLNDVAKSKVEPACLKMQNYYEKLGVKRQPVRIDTDHSEDCIVTIVHSERLPHQVAAAVLASILKYALGYKDIEMISVAEENNTIFALTEKYRLINKRNYEEKKALLRIWVSVPLNKEIGLHSFKDIGRSRVDSTPKLVVFLSEHAMKNRKCQTQNWRVYIDYQHLQDCDFLTDNSTKEVIVICNNESWKNALSNRFNSSEPFLKLKFKNDNQQIKKNTSLLYLGYNLWPNESRYVISNLPEVEYEDVLTEHVEFKIIGYSITHYAYRIQETVRKFELNMTTIGNIMSGNGSVKENACSWLNMHPDFVEPIVEPKKQTFNILVFICDDDPEKSKYEQLISDITRNINRELTAYTLVTKNITFRCPAIRTQCGSVMRDSIFNELVYAPLLNRVMAAIGPACGAGLAGKYANNWKTPLFLYEASELAPGAFDVTGGESRLWKALRMLLKEFKWHRIALLTDRSRYERRFLAPVEDDPELVSFIIDPVTNVTAVMSKLKEVSARVIVTLATWEHASAILCEAANRNMTPDQGYIWLMLTPRRSSLNTCGIHHYILTYSYIGQDDNVLISLRQQWMRSAVERVGWPSAGTQIVDTLSAAAFTFQRLLESKPDVYAEEYPHSEVAYDQFKELLNEYTTGVFEDFRFDRGRRADSSLFFYSGSKRRGTWKINDDGFVNVSLSSPFRGAPLDDGSTSCLLTVGDRFRPTCLDLTVLLPAGVLLVALVIFLVACRRTPASPRPPPDRLDVLGELSVDMQELTLGEALGRGEYGRVYSATWRPAGRPPLAVAVKTARSPGRLAEEDLLREAALTASLQHANVVRLLGVASANGPALLLERAVLGDVRGYLRARRNATGEEAAHVSARALTLLALQVARALSYLRLSRVVHRDVRAANCLLDSRRVLKLADFGLARRTGPDSEYAGVRRAMFPVAWMAPESLTRHSWSSASDVWSLGVLLVELSTLGARPFGSWSAARVVSHTAGGGSPRLSVRASPQLRGLAATCWRRRARDRPAAACLVQYLAEHPSAVAPCPSEEPSPPASPTPDSGYTDADYISIHTL